MKAQTLQEIEADVVACLRERAKAGDNEAANVLLNYLTQVSKSIDVWWKNKLSNQELAREYFQPDKFPPKRVGKHLLSTRPKTSKRHEAPSHIPVEQ